MDPAVVADEEGYHLFYSTLFCRKDGGLRYSWDPANPTDCSLQAPVSALGYAFSRDKGLHWEFRQTPAFEPSRQNAWETANVETANVVRVGQRLSYFTALLASKMGSSLKIDSKSALLLSI